MQCYLGIPVLYITCNEVVYLVHAYLTPGMFYRITRETNDFEIFFSDLRSADVMWGTSEDFRKAVVQNLLACTGSAVLSNCLPTARNVFLEFAIKYTT